MYPIDHCHHTTRHMYYVRHYMASSNQLNPHMIRSCSCPQKSASWTQMRCSHQDDPWRARDSICCNETFSAHPPARTVISQFPSTRNSQSAHTYHHPVWVARLCGKMRKCLMARVCCAQRPCAFLMAARLCARTIIVFSRGSFELAIL